jgi:hypothetical protein
MPPGSTKFCESWLSSVDQNGHRISDWCKKLSEFSGLCFLCNKDFDVRNQGRHQLEQHAKGKKHISTATVRLALTQRKFKTEVKEPGEASVLLEATSSSSQAKWSMTHEDKVTNAEILWNMQVAKAGYSYNSCRNISDIFQKMFQDSAIASDVKLGPDKISYSISHGLGPYFHNALVKEIQGEKPYFTFCYDEATTDAGEKQLDVYVR